MVRSTGHTPRELLTHHSHRLLFQIDGLENGTEYYVRVAAYNGPGGENATSESDEAFTTYGAPADASPFPITTIEQVCFAHMKQNNRSPRRYHTGGGREEGGGV